MLGGEAILSEFVGDGGCSVSREVADGHEGSVKGGLCQLVLRWSSTGSSTPYPALTKCLTISSPNPLAPSRVSNFNHRIHRWKTDPR